MRYSGLIIALVASASLGSGYLLGQANAPVDSMLAEAQVVAQDRQVQFIGYSCGDDGATVIARNPPTECKDIWRLNPDDEFKVPPRSRVSPVG
jgi:hypothetical protein